LTSYFRQTAYRYNSSIHDLVKNILKLYKNEERTDYLDLFIKITTDERYKCPAFELSEIYSQYNLNAFAYIYSYHISTSDVTNRYEAVHKDELAMIFAEPLSIKTPPLINPNIWTMTNHNYSIEERLISEQIATYWSNFVQNDDPNDLNNLKWLKFKQDSTINRNVIDLNGNQSKILPFSIKDMICNFFRI